MHAGYCSFVAQLSEAGEGDSGAGLSPAGLGETELFSCHGAHAGGRPPFSRFSSPLASVVCGPSQLLRIIVYDE